MNYASKAIIREAVRGSNAGRIHFREVVRLMLEAGVESYFADYRADTKTFYLASGESFSLDLESPDVGIPQAFDVDGIKAALRRAQQGEIMYPAFKQLTREAGCVGYTVWIAGRCATYFGRRGEIHVEHFPQQV